MFNLFIILRTIIRSIWVNFRYLPIHQALYLPIYFFKGHLKIKGKIIIKGKIKRGMIRLGFNRVSLYPDSGIMIENRGTIIFKGTTFIGNNSAISVNQSGVLEFGNQFSSSSGLKIACYDSIRFQENVLLGWDVLIIDSNFHALTNNKTGEVIRKGTASIDIGNDVWISNGCKLYKGVSIPPFCVVGANTVLHKAVKCSPYSLITNNQEVKIKTTGFYRDINDDKLNYHKG